MKEKIEKILKSQLKRKLTITTATLISFLLFPDVTLSVNQYLIGNNSIEKGNAGIFKDETEYLENIGLFQIKKDKIENNLKDSSNFDFYPVAKKLFVNKGKINELGSQGENEIRNYGGIYSINSLTITKVNNFGNIDYVDIKNDIVNKNFIDSVVKAKSIENTGYIWNIRNSSNIYNYGIIGKMKTSPTATVEKMQNYGILEFENNLEYNTINKTTKLENRGIIINDLNNFTPNTMDNEGKVIKNYKNQVLPIIDVDNEIINAYEITMDKNLNLKNNSTLNIHKGKIEIDKKISINNSMVNIDYLKYNGGVELELKNNSSIGSIEISPLNMTDKLKKLTIDNTIYIGGIKIDGDINEISLVSNISDKNRILRINQFLTEAQKIVNTNISTNVDLLGSSQLGNIIVRDGGRLTIAKDALGSNGRASSSSFYKKDIKIEGNGKILIGIDPYKIGVVEDLGKGNNLTASVVGQVDTADPKLRLAQDKLNIAADSLLHDIVIMPEEEVTYEKGLPSEYKAKVRNKYKVIEQLDLPTPPVTPPVPPTGKPVWDYDYLNAVYRSLYDAGKVKEFSVYNKEELDGLYQYLRDIYANNPYTVTAETSFRNLDMFRADAYSDLKPNLKKWAVMGGLSHSDRENKYKMGTTEVDTKTTGAYAKGEYGLKEDTTLGLILGGTNSKSDMSTGRVKGSSMYLGAYAKKYINNYKFTLGTGMDLGEYKVDRNAIGYAGIIETTKEKAKQKNRAFDLYAEARYTKDLGNNFYLEPNFTLAYSRVKQGGATENDGKVNLNVKSKTFKQTKAELGLDLKKVLVNGNTSHNFVLGASYERALSGTKDSSARANVVGGREFDILVPAREKGRTSMGAEYRLENKVGLLFNLKMDYGFNHGSDKKDIRFSTGIGYKF